MLRVIHQEESRALAEAQFFLHGAGKKGETFGRFLTRQKIRTTTPEDAESSTAAAERTVAQVRQRLGRFYRPPIKA